MHLSRMKYATWPNHRQCVLKKDAYVLSLTQGPRPAPPFVGKTPLRHHTAEEPTGPPRPLPTSTSAPPPCTRPLLPPLPSPPPPHRHSPPPPPQTSCPPFASSSDASPLPSGSTPDPQTPPQSSPPPSCSWKADSTGLTRCDRPPRPLCVWVILFDFSFSPQWDLHKVLDPSSHNTEEMNVTPVSQVGKTDPLFTKGRTSLFYFNEGTFASIFRVVYPSNFFYFGRGCNPFQRYEKIRLTDNYYNPSVINT
ncbi:hypothetical protein J437_LFUL007695 [Ladona fulva]|uniref:Uncharacterized protein n=1 Tax=Ladona fulva TaxID=123851 RepID=A0A8K0K1L6_LADFU|nr:hypothetical protein J437_LFUL007695 [Ladona fulva]